jgi:signal transduction histidine kinase/ActR/RegA family two-component response regulator
MLRKISLLFFIICNCFALQANSLLKKDSILKAISSATNEQLKIDLFNDNLTYFIDNGTQVIEYASNLLALAQKTNYEKGIYDSYLSLGVGHCENRNFDSAIFYISKALTFYYKANNKNKIVRCNNYLGISYESKTNFSTALFYYFQALNLATQIHDSLYIVKSLNNIGVVYFLKAEFKPAEKFLLQSLPIAKKLNAELSLIYYNLASIYLEKKQFAKALEKFELVLEDDLKSNDIKNIAETYNNIGMCYLGLNQLGIAESYLNKAFDIREKINDENGLRNSLTDLADLHIKNKRYAKALIFLEKAENLAKKTNNKVAQVTIYETYIKCYKAQNDYVNALAYTELKMNFLQAISSAESMVKLKDLQAQSTTKQKETETEVTLQKQKNKTITIGLLVTIILFIIAIMVFLIFTVYNIRKTNILLKNNQIQLTVKNDALVKQNEQILKSQELAKQALKTKASFIRNISHEIRTPLNAINGIAAIFKADSVDEEHIRNLYILQQSTNKLIHLINDILDLNNLESGNNDFNYNDFKLHQLVNGLVNIFNEKIKAKGLEFIVDCDISNQNTYKSDALRIAQVLSNLITNAINFTENGYLKLSIKEMNASFFKSTINFEISDSGVGIPIEKQADIFEAFSQVDTSNTRKKDGAGLGLSLCQKIVEGLGGKIMLKSEVGIGSKFSFELALDIVETKHTININFTKTVINSLDNTNILIVEDSIVNVIILKQFLKKWNCNVTVADNGLVGLALTKENKYDLILMDLQMPEMDGITCTREIRALNDQNLKKVPIIALTAANENTMRDAAYAAGMNDYILKPFDSKNLQEKMLRAINESLS